MKSRQIKTTLVFAMMFFLFTFVQAQEKKRLTLQDAIVLSISHSPNLKLSEAKIAEANAALRIARDNRLPEAKVTGSHIRLNSPNIDLKTNTSSNGNGNTSGTPEVKSATYGILNVSLPLYAGNKIRYGIESSRYLAEAVKLDAIADRDAIMLNTINAFANLYKANAAVRVVRENVEGNQERVRQFTNLEKNGLLARNDLLKAKLQESNTALTLYEAENNLKLANANMNIMLGLGDSTILEPITDSWSTGEKDKSIEDYLQMAIQHRKDVEALNLRNKAAKTDINIAKAAYYPSLSLTGGYIAANVPHLLTVTNAANVGVGVSYSISSLWKNHAAVDEAKARQMQIEANAGSLADGVKMEVNQAYYDYTLSLQKIITYRSAVEQAEENYRITKNKYDNALVNTTDLLDADVAQLQAKLNFVFAEADASAAYSRLLHTAGLLARDK